MVCTFFGHKDTPKEIEPTLRATLIALIENSDVTDFYVGNNGNFDAAVCRQLESLAIVYPINFSTVLAYVPKSKSENNNYTNAIIPEGIETVPKRFSISWRNRWMVQKSDIVVAYVTRSFGGAYQFMELAKKQNKPVINLSMFLDEKNK